MFRILLILMMLLTRPAAAEDLKAISDPLASPNGQLEVYRLPEGMDKDVNGNNYGYGTKLFLRIHGDQNHEILLRENDRWMAVEWSPDSRLLAIEDHWDGHASEIYVYKVSISFDGKLQQRLVFHTPENTYDLKWFIEGWGPNNGILRLRREQRTNDGIETPASWKNHASVEHVVIKIES